jgi:hypothetical protein
MTANRTHVSELIDEFLRLLDTNLKTTLSLKGVFRGSLAFLPAQAVTEMVNGIWVNPEPSTLIEPIQLPSDLLVHYQFRLIYVRRINVNENVLKQKEADVKLITEMVFDNYQLSNLTLTNGQVLWWLPTEIEWEPPEDGYVATLADDLIGLAFKTECKVRTRR